MVKHRRASASVCIAFLAMCIILMVPAQPASAQIVFDNATFSDFIVDADAFDHTIGGGDKRMLIVGVGREFPTDPAVTATYNGVAMTRIPGAEVRIETGAGQHLDLFWLDESGPLPAAGTYEVAVTSDGTNASGAISLENVAQGPPEATAANGDFESAALLEMSVEIIALTDGAWVIDALGSGHNFGDQIVEPLIQTVHGVSAGEGNTTVMSTYEVATAGPTTVGYTFDVANRTAISVAAFAPGTPPIFLTTPVGGTALVGESFTFEVALSNPVGTPSYQWKRDVGSGVEDVGPDASTYLLSDLLEIDTGLYWVDVTDDTGTFITDPVALTVGAAIPTAQTWGLVFVALLLLASGTRLVRRRALQRR